MSIDYQLSKRFEKYLENEVLLNLKKILGDLENHVTDGYVELNNGFSYEIKKVNRPVSEKEQLTYDELKAKLNIIKELNLNDEKQSIKTSFEIIRLEEKMEAIYKHGYYLHIKKDDGSGYLYGMNNYDYFIVKTYPDLPLDVNNQSEIKFDNVDEYIKRINEYNRKYRNYSDSEYANYASRLNLKDSINKYILSERISDTGVLSFSFYSKVNDSRFYNIEEVNNALNAINLISELKDLLFLKNDEIIEKYNSINKSFMNAVSKNIKLKFNQVFNIMEEHFKDEREDFNDLDNHISLIKLKKMPNNRAILMETQSRNLVAIEMDNGEIVIYKLAEKEFDLNSSEFYYNYTIENGTPFTEKLLLMRSKANDYGIINDTLDNDFPEYPSLEFFVNKFDGTQLLSNSISLSTYDNFKLKNMLNENMAYIILTECQKFLCCYKNISFDKHDEIDVFSVDYNVKKDMSMFNHSYEYALVNNLFDEEINYIRFGAFLGNDGTDIPFDYSLEDMVEKDPELSPKITWRMITCNKITREDFSLPDDIRPDYIDCLVEALDIVKNYFDTNNELIKDIEVFNKSIEQVENVINKARKNRKKLKP